VLLTQIHPARAQKFEDLIAGLRRAVAAGFVHRRACARLGLHLYVYTPRCVYEDGWDDFSRMARGLILDEEAGRIVATPFPKFFNLGERHGTVPDLPFEVFEKLDGSLIIVFHHRGLWHAATKGAFDSEQALWAQERLNGADLSALQPGATYLFEAVYPENRIVIRYSEPEMVMLGGYQPDGSELSYDEIETISRQLGGHAAKRHVFQNIPEMVANAAALPRDYEGYVLRFSNGLRLKIKGAEYRRIHALISRCTPLAMWEALDAGDDLAAIRRDLPEEFWTDFDQIIVLLQARITALEDGVAALAASVAHLSDKELGLALPTLPAETRPYLFAYRKSGAITGNARKTLLRSIRPAANALPGYTPSYAMGRMLEEAVS
jgi:RNA ligase